jgi:type IX secretion system PorP/SprF family membrane protein
MMRKGALILIFSLCMIFESFGQDPQFSQYYASPLYLNPAFAGTGFAHRISLNSRIQWPSLPQAFISNAISWDLTVPSFNSGFGVIAVTDKAGSVGLRSTSFGIVYAYKVYISKKWVWSSGLNFKYAIRDLDFTKLLFGDQLEFGGPDAPTIDPAANNLRSAGFFDFDFGMLFYSDKVWLGMAASHLNQPNTSFIEDEYRLPMKFTMHAGVKIPLNTGMFASKRPTHITPSIYYKRQDSFDQLDVGVNYYYEPIKFGVWYRGIPIQKFTGPQGDSYLSHDAIIFLVGFAAWNFECNYSYDFTMSQLGVSTNGAHEFSLTYQFKTKKIRKIRKKVKSVPCPAFYNDNLELNPPAWMRIKGKKKKSGKRKDNYKIE